MLISLYVLLEFKQAVEKVYGSQIEIFPSFTPFSTFVHHALIATKHLLADPTFHLARAAPCHSTFSIIFL